MVESDAQKIEALPVGASSSADSSPSTVSCDLVNQPSYFDNLVLSAAQIYHDACDIDVKKKAKVLYDDTMWIRGLFGALDGLIISYSTFKYIFDFVAPRDASSSDVMHDWMVTGPGALGACVTSLAIITLSLVGNLFDDGDKNPLKRSMAMIWPYVRDGFKGLKFAYKGIRSTVQTAQLMGFDLRAMMFPVGLVLGLAAAANRIWYRIQVTEKRKEYQKHNNQLLERAQNLGMNTVYDLRDGGGIDDNDLVQQTIYFCLPPKDGFLEYRVKNPAGNVVKGKLSIEHDLKDLAGNRALSLEIIKQHQSNILKTTGNNGHTATANTSENREAIRKLIKDDTKKDDTTLPDRHVVIASALLGGFVDGLYTYMGAMGLAALSPPLFGAMLVCCMIFTVICVLNRYYEEDQYQNEYLRSAKNVEWVLAAKTVNESFLELQAISEKIASNALQYKKDKDALLTEQNSDAISLTQAYELQTTLLFEGRIPKEREALGVIEQEYHDLYHVSTGRAVLMGLRNGIYFYSAVSGIVFAYAAFCTVFPPALLITAVAIGLVSLFAFVVHSVLVNDAHNEALKGKNAHKARDEKYLNLQAFIGAMKQIFMAGQKIEPQPEREREVLMDGLLVDPIPDVDGQKITEVLRAACSGLNQKGNKSFDFVGEYWLEKDSQGHYQEASWMTPLGAVLSIFYSVVYALRAFGKGFRGANDVPLPSLLKPVEASPRSSTSSSFGSAEGGTLIAMHSQDEIDEQHSLDRSDLQVDRPQTPRNPVGLHFNRFIMFASSHQSNDELNQSKSASDDVLNQLPISAAASAAAAYSPYN